MATTPPSRRLQRWTRTERAVHWVHATAFCILLATGLCLYLPSLAELIGRRPLLKHVHLYTAASWAAALVVIVLVGDRRSLLRTAREVDLLGVPSRMNLGQKLNTIATAFFLFVGHLYYALVLPSTRHSLSGMTRGWVDARWAARRHPEWVETMQAEAGDAR